MSCDELVSGKPKANVEWFKEGAQVEAGDTVQMYEEDGVHCLCLKKAQLENGGSYCCTASNARGQASTRWILTVKSKYAIYCITCPDDCFQGWAKVEHEQLSSDLREGKSRQYRICSGSQSLL